MKHWLRQPTWWCALSPLVFLMLFVTLAIHLRLGLGHWPKPCIENYDTSLFTMHWNAMGLSMLAALFLAPAIWFVLILVRYFRISLRIHILQVMAYVLCWGMVFLIGWLDPTSFTDWFLD